MGANNRAGHVVFESLEVFVISLKMLVLVSKMWKASNERGEYDSGMQKIETKVVHQKVYFKEIEKLCHLATGAKS